MNAKMVALITLNLFLGFYAIDPSKATAQESSGQSETTTSTSQAELANQKASDERRIIVIQSQLNSWKQISAALISVNQQVANANAPTGQDFAELEQLFKKKDYQHIKPRLVRLATIYQTLFARLQFGFNSPQLDSDVSLVVADWDAKLLKVAQPIANDVTPLNRLVFSSDLPKAGEINIEDLKHNLSPDIFKKIQTDLLAVLKSDTDIANQNINNSTQELSRLQKESDAIGTKLTKSKLEINQMAIELGLPLLCGTVLLMLSIPIVIQSYSRAAGSAEQVKAIFSSGILVEIITVLLLTMSILILGLANRFEGPVLGTLLGGISGYVLNRFRGKQNDDANNLDDSKSKGGSKDTAFIPG
jgi:hypothetical protein